MTVIVFALALLLMARQAINMRVEVVNRERRATRMVEERYASLIANASDVIMIVRPDGVMRFTSPASERMLGLKAEDIVGSNLLDLWAGADVELLRAFLAEVAATPDGTVGPVELRIENRLTGFVLEIVGSNLTNDPAVNGFALNFRDISERTALEEKLRQLAFHDPLTLLANRSLFRNRVQHALTLAQRGPTAVAVLFLDLDNFKDINDSLGHEAGDKLLQAVAERLIRNTRSSDTVARLGGDEFAVLIEGITTSAEAEYMAGVLVASLGLAFLLNATEVQVGTSIGVALSTPQSNAAALLSNTDLAMYHAKAAGKNRFATFQPQMLEVLNERLRLEADLARAFDNEEFFRRLPAACARMRCQAQCALDRSSSRREVLGDRTIPGAHGRQKTHRRSGVARGGAERPVQRRRGFGPLPEPTQIGLAKVAVREVDVGDIDTAQVETAKVATA